MTLSEVADLATIVASLLAVVGVGWLVFVQIRRHRRVRKDVKFLRDAFGRALELESKTTEAIRLLEQTTGEDRANALLESVAMRIHQAAAQLLLLQVNAIMLLARQHDADQEVANLLADWKLRSPITRER